jgi:hypothetical protein
VLDALKTLPNPDAGGARTASLTPSR